VVVMVVVVVTAEEDKVWKVGCRSGGDGVVYYVSVLCSEVCVCVK
jgi:hypothetical protein